MALSVLHPPRQLQRTDDRSDFCSGAAELDQWFSQYAWDNLRANNATTYVLEHEERILGFYAIAAAGIGKDRVAPSFGNHRPQDIPCVLLARLAIDERYQRRSLGKVLFRDAIERAVQVSGVLGAAALLIHARDEDAKQFYCANADLLESPVEPLHLVLPMKVAKKIVSAASLQA